MVAQLRIPRWQRRVREQARQILGELSAIRHRIWPRGVDAEELVRDAPDLIPKFILGVTVRRVEEIPPQSFEQLIRPTFETAGLVDRERRLIVIAQKFKLEQRRFTLAHEIGHWVLHPRMTLHRDRPLSGHERRHFKPPRCEREADVFAAELLMPEGLLRAIFWRLFGGPIEGARPDDDLAYWLSLGTGNKVDPVEFSRRDPFDRALLIATFRGEFMGTLVAPLGERFEVSRSAMAKQLVDLGLVT